MQDLRYVVLRHEGIADPHFDLMIESTADAPLITWRSPDWPITRDTNFTRLAEHRRLYLDFEGPLSDGRGYVNRVESGACQVDWTTRFDCTVIFTSPPLTIRLKRLDDDHWLATPSPASA